MEAIKSKSIKKPIVLLKLYDDGSLLVIDNETTIRFLDNDSLSLLDGFKARVKHDSYKGRVVDYSNNKLYLATLSSDLKESRLYNIKKKRIITRFSRHHGEVSCVKIDPKNKFMLSGGDDGKTFAIDVVSGKLMFTLLSHVDTINDIGFSQNGNWVATASYDRKVSVFNLVTMTAKERFRSHSAPVMHLQFFHKNKLLSIDKDSKGIIWDIHKSKVISRLQGIHDDVRKVVVSGDEHFLFIGTALGYVIVFDLHTYEMIAPRFIKITSPITAMEFDSINNHLIIGTEDGFLIYYDIYEGLDVIKELLQKKQIDKIQAEVDKNPILKYTQVYDLVSDFWEKSLEKARIALENRQPDKAKLILEQFKDVPSKNKVIQKLFQDFSQYDKFIGCVKQGKLALAYSLANSYPAYKKTKIYDALEKQWKTVFARAQKMILDPKTTQMAKDILAPYRGISEKTKYIQELMTQSNVYKRFRESLGKKDFRTAMQLIKQNPFLQLLPEYTSLTNFADNLYFKTHDAINKKDFNTAMKYLNDLINFDDFKEEAQEKLKELEVKQKFYLAVKTGNISDAFDAMAEYEDLEETAEGKQLRNQWNKDVNIANTYAVNGDVVVVKKALEKYLQIQSKYISLATIFSWTYISQIERTMKEKKEKSIVENGIKNYLSLFGLTDQIESLYESFQELYPDSKLNLELLKKGDITKWIPSMIVKSILE
ncbi:MAG: hypothetical protein FAF05_00705 [Epsilonproteobacteria bacterium]|nr:hypothetical protein [Campylobacterota bacterium]